MSNHTSEKAVTWNIVGEITGRELLDEMIIVGVLISTSVSIATIYHLP